MAPAKAGAVFLEVSSSSGFAAPGSSPGGATLIFWHTDDKSGAASLAQDSTPTTPVPREQVQIKPYDDVYVRRSRTVDAWVLDIWVKDAGVGVW
jgi:hypothetical protein